MIKYLSLVLLLSLSLVGCATQPKYEKVEFTKVKIIKQEVPKELTEPCIPSRPLKKEEYLQLKPYEREAFMTGYAISLLGVIKECNTRMMKIRELFSENH